MAIVTRAGKGSELTHVELDTNFTDLRDGVDILVPKTQGKGIKVDSLGTPDWAWADLIGELYPNPSGLNAPSFNVYRTPIRAFQMTAGDELFADFHLPHDYAIGTAIYIHIHWSVASATLTGGSTTWNFGLTYAKGHNQGAFIAPITIAIVQNASLTQYQHMIAETVASSVGGSATTLDTDDLEPDGVIQSCMMLDSNDLTDSVTVPDPFVHFVDIHYQSTGIGTKAKTPDFWT